MSQTGPTDKPALPMARHPLLLVTGAVVGVTALLMLTVNPLHLAAHASVMAAGASLLAVLWFATGQRTQAAQLKEQREQFSREFKALQEMTRRDALLMAKNILDGAEQRAVAHHGGISSSSELITCYLHLSELEPLMESTDPDEVIEAFKSWMKKEGAALTLMQGLKSAAEVYLRSIGATEIDYKRKPEDFVFIYGNRFFDQPFFDAHATAATMLGEFMVHLAPGRSAAQIAFLAASARSVGPGLVGTDKLQAEMARHKAQGYPLPKIAEAL